MSHSNLASLFSAVSAASLSLIRCKIWSLSVTLSAANLSVCAEATHLLQSGIFISSSFSCQAFKLMGSHLFYWQSEQISSVCSYLSPPTFPAIARLSLPALLVPSSYWQSGSAVKQDLCRLLCSACLRIHRHTLGIHTPAAYSDVAANTTAIPCTVNWHTPSVLPGYLL